MMFCAIKVCRNYKGRLRTIKTVTYHRIPNDPIIRNRWIEIIRKSRGEDVWQPAKTSVVCSDHFRAKDLYFVNEQKRRRLKKAAIPCKALFLSSIQTDTDDESDDSVEDAGKIKDCVTYGLDDTKSLESNEKESCGVTKDEHYTSSFMVTSDNITGKASGDTSSSIPGQASSSKIGEERKTENESDVIEGNASGATSQASSSKIGEERKTENESDYSDLDSVYDSPGKSKLRRDLRRRILLQRKHTIEIQSLKRKNLRLQKEIASLKQIIGTLTKKDIPTDNDTHNILSK